VTVPPNGYRWWYLDAIGDDGRQGLTVIAFIGSVFSPYYAFARRSGAADPENHCAINVALYGRSGRWCMTERGRAAVTRGAERFSVGPSSIAWEDGTLVVRIDEIAVPIPRRVCGEIRLTPGTICGHSEALDAGGAHVWRPVAPVARVKVSFAEPKLDWEGGGYHDMNWGPTPLESSFASWTWSRAPLTEGTCVLYDIERRDGTSKSLALRIDGRGSVSQVPLPPKAGLGRAFWRMPRVTRSEGHASLVRSLEDAPFYTRSLIRSELCGERVTAVHESLSLDRFRMPVVQAMLPFRMPRWAS
jgi:carotenoid 1,2-hydratase